MNFIHGYQITIKEGEQKETGSGGGTAPGIGGGNMSVEISKHIYILSRSYMGCR